MQLNSFVINTYLKVRMYVFKRFVNRRLPYFLSFESMNIIALKSTKSNIYIQFGSQTCSKLVPANGVTIISYSSLTHSLTCSLACILEVTTLRIYYVHMVSIGAPSIIVYTTLIYAQHYFFVNEMLINWP